MLALLARRVAGRTRLARLECRPPLQAMRAHHLDAVLPDMAFVIVSSPGGGVLQGDRLDVSVEVEAGARVHLDTSSATRLYRMPNGEARSAVELRVGPGACLELVSDPYLPFSGARFHQETRAFVDEAGVLVLAEVVAAGRAARGEQLRYQRFESVLDSVRRRRSDGAMVRVMVPMGESQKEAEKTAIELASRAAAELPAYIPN